jgi:transcriptional regulator with XRE-family HTH domain
MGWSIREAAAQLGIDPDTWADWERGKVILYRAHRVLVARLLGLSKGDVDQTMAAAWIRSHK